MSFKENSFAMTTTPTTRNARQAKILEILDRTRVTSQVQLSELLLDEESTLPRQPFRAILTSSARRK